jgi:hypothetical protein
MHGIHGIKIFQISLSCLAKERCTPVADGLKLLDSPQERTRLEFHLHTYKVSTLLTLAPSVCVVICL